MGVHIVDVADAIAFACTSEVLWGRTFNITAPGAATNCQMLSALAVMRRRWCCYVPVPGFILRPLLGESAAVVLDSQLVESTLLSEAGFHFKYPYLHEALATEACL